MFIMPPLDVIMPSIRIENGIATCRLEDLKTLLYSLLQSVPVEEEWYLSAYPDVEKAIAAGEVASAADHYRKSGYLVGRLPIPPVVEEDWYRATYPDVAASIEAGEVVDARTHFITSGWREGRLPAQIPVDEAWYLRRYPAAALRLKRGESASATEDFQRCGYREGLMPFRTAP